MSDNENRATALGSESVDAEFWALVCDDEEWLRTEFDGIVSEPAETPVSQQPPLVVAAGPDGSGSWFVRSGRTQSWTGWPRAGQTWQHQRSPPSRADAVR